jgi:hypothetical protein
VARLSAGGKAGHVPSVQHEGGRPVGPTPYGDVVEECAQFADGVMAYRDAPAGGCHTSLADPGGVVGDELVRDQLPGLVGGQVQTHGEELCS